jgi:ribose transport system ATP-binding protein
MILHAENISKTYGPTRALNSVSLAFDVGKVHALVGENGAGKSTLFKILSGYVEMDHGEITYNGGQLDPVSALESVNNDVVLVHQELNVNTSIGIAENIYFNQMRKFSNFFGFINKNEMQRQAQKLLDDIDAQINVQWDIKDLDLGQLKIIQVAQALAKGPKVIFLDESTAYLNISEIKSLLKVVETLRSRGIAIGFVSHHLNEVEMVADTLSILKDGCLVGTFPVGSISPKEIESLMVGREQAYDFYKKIKNFSQEISVLEMQSIKIPRVLESTSISLKKGEILGIGGLKGAGGEAILETIIGELLPTQGNMLLNGEQYKPNGVFDANAAGISYLPGNRQTEGLITEFSIRDNMVMSDMPSKSIFFDVQTANKKSEYFKEYLSLRADNIKDPCDSLSGGNMQKVVLAKCLIPSPKILLLNNPTRGIDVATRYDIYKKIHDLSRIEGLSVILLSEDLIELMGMSDRLIIFKKGKITKEFDYMYELTEKEIVSYMI